MGNAQMTIIGDIISNNNNGISDAPSNGDYYSRQLQAWKKIGSIADVVITDEADFPGVTNVGGINMHVLPHSKHWKISGNVEMLNPIHFQEGGPHDISGATNAILDFSNMAASKPVYHTSEMTDRISILNYFTLGNLSCDLYDIISTSGLNPNIELFLYGAVFSTFASYGTINGVTSFAPVNVLFLDALDGLTLTNTSGIIASSGTIELSVGTTNKSALTVHLTDGGKYKIVNFDMETDSDTNAMFNFIDPGGITYNTILALNNSEIGRFYATTSINQKNVNSLWAINSGFLSGSSKAIAFIYANENATTTSVTGTGTQDPVTLNVIEGSNLEGWSVFNAVTGELEYLREQDLNATMLISFTHTKTSAARQYLFRLTKSFKADVVRSPDIDDVTVEVNISTTTRNASLLVPCLMITGDRVQLTIEEIGTSSDTVLISGIQMSII